MRREPAFAVPPAFARTVSAAFSQRRKTLRNALRSLVDVDGHHRRGHRSRRCVRRHCRPPSSRSSPRRCRTTSLPVSSAGHGREPSQDSRRRRHQLSRGAIRSEGAALRVLLHDHHPQRGQRARAAADAGTGSSPTPTARCRKCAAKAWSASSRISSPGQGFRYSSGAVLETPVGAMQGSYQMVADDGEQFDAPIAPFRLAMPGMLH